MMNLYELMIKEKFLRRDYYQAITDYNLTLAIGTEEEKKIAKAKMDMLKDNLDDLNFKIEEAKWRQRGA
ncbi:hypothetical protein [Wukongibacter sp. M2B1]|uniref:hypothetical protein n=1 Tax=Wukongibacter sp. M2B1 TaxID=3088895 RepID=UPI003D79EEF8